MSGESQLFSNGVIVEYNNEGSPYWWDGFEWIALSPYEYGYIDHNGDLILPTAPTLSYQEEEASTQGGGCVSGIGNLLMLVFIGAGAFVAGGHIVNSVVQGNEGKITVSEGEGQIQDLVGGLNIPYLYPRVREVEGSILDFGHKFGVDANLVAIIILYESGGDASNDTDMIDVGIAQMTEGAMITVNSDTTPEEREYVGLPDGRPFTMDDLKNDEELSVAAATFLIRFYQRYSGISMYDAYTLARLYNGGPGAIDGPTGELNEKYANDIGGLVTQLKSGMNGSKIQELIASGRIAPPSQ